MMNTAMLISGIVIAGKKRGRTLGFPTANIQINVGVEPGVYAGWVFLEREERMGSALYIHPDQKLLEAYLLNFKGDLYGHKIVIELGEKIRDSKYFDSIEMLKEQISQDVEKIREILYGKKKYF
jgi:riboflavin kinase/FMN adenylyltransferase